MEKGNLKELTVKSYTEENFVIDLVGTKRLLEVIEKYDLDTESELYELVIKKSIERLRKEL
jgi:hypothetical protein